MYRHYDDVLWDPIRAEKNSVKDYVHNCVLHNRKEEGMILLHKREYKMDDFFSNLDQVEPIDGSHWSTDKKNKFHRCLMDYGKDIAQISKIFNESVKCILCYYYGSYKFTADYAKFKKMNKQERLRCERLDLDLEEGEYCVLCNGYGNLICCDGCDNCFHFQCISPPLERIPDGPWHCEDCQEKSFGDDNKRIIVNENVLSFKKKRKIEPITSKKNYLLSQNADNNKKDSISIMQPGSLCKDIIHVSTSVIDLT